MTSEPKAFASLSSGLLARKGAARPAMRPQGFGQTGAAGLEDLGWNDMGFEAPKPAASPLRDATHDGFGEEIPASPSRTPLAGLTPVHSPVHTQHAEIVDRFAASPSGLDDDVGEEEYDDTAEMFDPEQVEAPAAFEPVAFEPVVFEPEAASVPEQVVEAAPAPVAEPPVQVEAAPVARSVPAKPNRVAKPRSAPGSKAKAAFTLRLDPARHLKLRLACAVGGRSAQQLVTDALDVLLSDMPELEAMAAKANRKG